MKQKVEQILGTVKGSDETWESVFTRLERDGRIDFKVIIKIVALFLDEWDRRSQAATVNKEAVKEDNGQVKQSNKKA